MKSISIGMLPPAVKKIAMTFADSVKTYTCETPVELIKLSSDKPLELFLVAQTNKEGNVEKHFMLGLAIPCKTDAFKTPLLYMAPVTYEQYIKYEKLLKDKLKIKEISRKSNVWLPRV